MERRDECRYCGEVRHGYGCAHSPNHYHEEVGDSEHCIYCGSTSYGSNCSFAPEDSGKLGRMHKHGHGNKKCVWCGSTSKGMGCPFSESGYHEF